MNTSSPQGNSQNTPSESFADKVAKLSLEGIRRAAIESDARKERGEKIFSIEKKSWPHGMGNKLRSQIPEELHEELDRCIEKSQVITRAACQTPELTEAYLKNNTGKHE